MGKADIIGPANLLLEGGRNGLSDALLAVVLPYGRAATLAQARALL